MYRRSTGCFPSSQSPLGCLSIGRAPRVPQQMGCECLYVESRVAGKLSNESTRSVYAGGGTCRAARVWEGEGAGPTE